VRLSAPSLAAKSGVTLGGAAVAADGSFAGTVPEALGGGRGTFTVQVAPASAAVVTLSARGASTPLRP
jgi:hypothetical protein